MDLKELQGQEFSDIDDSGFETTVYKSESLPWVVKELKNEDDSRKYTKNGYKLAMESLASEIPSTQTISSLSIRHQTKPIQVKEGFAQEKVIPLDKAIERRTKKELESIAQGLAHLDHTIMSKGVYVFDNFTKNCGVKKDSRVVIIDLGCLTLDIDQIETDMKDLFYQPHAPVGRDHRFNKRGFVLYLRRAQLSKVYPKIKKVHDDAFGLKFRESVNLNYTQDDLFLYQDAIAETLESSCKLPRSFYQNKLEFIIALCDQMHPVQGFIFNSLVRNKYAREFEEIAQAEYEQFFKKS